ncbi:isochorismatase family protein [Vagococcus intermedius]|uniref:Isochorismatase family protein n=1 Tax=Vagococcus intermedius TaxID=2991418 RepID=A0AAF0CTG9_9ENTE|nr:isochorismatase family protein [Vagococcus intermedius]WEG72551.1 isochorismatase family protein [Vagococcus intermedius]WEG74637.1 isochorismatase family protein [Vagococcus intermedius]
MLADCLLVIDLQVGLDTVEAPLHELERIVYEVNQRIALYRSVKRPIIFIQHEDERLVNGSSLWELLAGLNNDSVDYYVSKKTANAFYHTILPDILRHLNVKSIEFCGAQTEYCMDTAIRFAHGNGYYCYMKPNLHTTSRNKLASAETIIKHHEAIWRSWFLKS